MNPQQPFGPQNYAPIEPTPAPQQPIGSQPQPYMPQPSPQPSPYIVPAPKPSKIWLILSIVFIITTLSAAGIGIWAYMNYVDQRDNVDSKVDTAVAVAVKDQADKDAAAFLEKEKQPNRQFAGPDDLGRVTFDYPKTWSIYVADEGARSNTYKAYFNPVTVPPESQTQQYALRLTIENVDYDKALGTYKRFVDDGSLRSSAVKADDQNGTRLDGKFSDDIQGSAVIFKIRDKTVTIRTDADVFKADFDALISTITFNK